MGPFIVDSLQKSKDSLSDLKSQILNNYIQLFANNVQWSLWIGFLSRDPSCKRETLDKIESTFRCRLHRSKHIHRYGTVLRIRQ